jgi:hypothetical protein
VPPLICRSVRLDRAAGTLRLRREHPRRQRQIHSQDEPSAGAGSGGLTPPGAPPAGAATTSASPVRVRARWRCCGSRTATWQRSRPRRSAWWPSLSSTPYRTSFGSHVAWLSTSDHERDETGPRRERHRCPRAVGRPGVLFAKWVRRWYDRGRQGVHVGVRCRKMLDRPDGSTRSHGEPGGGGGDVGSPSAHLAAQRPGPSGDHRGGSTWTSCAGDRRPCSRAGRLSGSSP